jgi:hypothetical protein
LVATRVIPRGYCLKIAEARFAAAAKGGTYGNDTIDAAETKDLPEFIALETCQKLQLCFRLSEVLACYY